MLLSDCRDNQNLWKNIKIGYHRPASETPFGGVSLADQCWPVTLCWLGCHQLKIMLISVEVDVFYTFFVRYNFSILNTGKKIQKLYFFSLNLLNVIAVLN